MNAKSQLDEQARKTRAEYYRQWRAKNPDKVREKNRRYWLRRAQKLREVNERGADDAKTDP